MKRVVVEAHRSNYPNPVRFQRGDRVAIGRRDQEFPGWVWVATEAGIEGWAPEQYLDVSDDMAVARRDYQATELDTDVGEQLEQLQELNDWAWVVNDRGEEGWVPLRTLRLAQV